MIKTGPTRVYFNGKFIGEAMAITLDDARKTIDDTAKAIQSGTLSPVTMSVGFDAAKHPRGNTKNRGQFSKTPGGGAPAKPAAKADQAPAGDKPGPTAQPAAPASKPPSGDKKPLNAIQKAKADSPKPIEGTSIEHEAIAPPPPGEFYAPNVEAVGASGVAESSRVGVPAFVVPPPPSKLPRLPNLTPNERKVEDTFASAFEKDPDGLVAKYMDVVANSGKPYTFETDGAKLLSDDWKDENPDMQMTKRHLHNNALHQTANAIVKRAFLKHLDTLQKGDNVLVTVGGCGSGKGYTLKNTERGKTLTSAAKAVWDSAGDQNATENPWILAEAQKRGLTVTYAYVDADPKVSWADPGRGVVKRAHDNADGRMVDAAVFADSYVLGAKNMHAFHETNKATPGVNFLFFRSGSPDELPGVPPEALNMDRKGLYHWAMGSILSRTDVTPTVMRGGTNGARIWNKELGASA